MIHKVRFGWMEVTLDTDANVGRTPDLVFKEHDEREFAVFFAPFGTTEGERMKAAYYDYYAPYEAATLEEALDEATV